MTVAVDRPASAPVVVLRDPGAFTWAYLQARAFLPFGRNHLGIFRAVKKAGEDRRYRRLLIASPTGSRKSTIAGFGCVTWMLVVLGLRVAVLAGSQTLANRTGEWLLEELEENEDLRAHFPRACRPRGHWTAECVQMANGGELRCFGAGAHILGFRPDVWVLDDVEDDELVLSPTRREKFERWFWSTVFNRLPPWGILMVIGTPLHPQSMICKLRKRRGWVKLWYPAIDTQERSVWPALWPLEELYRRRDEISEHAWMMDFMLEPLDESSRIWKVERIRWEAAPPPPAELDNLIAGDFALKEGEENDFTSYVVTGYHAATQTLWGLAEVRGHWSLAKQMEELVALARTWGCQQCGIEAAQYEIIRAELRRLTNEQKWSLPVLELRPRKSKRARALGVSALVEKGYVHFLRSMGALHSDLADFPDLDFDDAHDAWVYSLMLQQRRHPHLSVNYRAVDQEKIEEARAEQRANPWRAGRQLLTQSARRIGY